MPSIDVTKRYYASPIPNPNNSKILHALVIIFINTLACINVIASRIL